jgi:hypothetical protein
MASRNKQWFSQPSAVINLLKTVHEMVRLDKVPEGKFSSDVCTKLLSADTASIDYLKRPSHKKHEEIVVDGFLNEVIALNSSCKKTVQNLQRLKSEEI